MRNEYCLEFGTIIGAVCRPREVLIAAERLSRRFREGEIVGYDECCKIRLHESLPIMFATGGLRFLMNGSGEQVEVRDEIESMFSTLTSLRGLDTRKMENLIAGCVLPLIRETDLVMSEKDRRLSPGNVSVVVGMMQRRRPILLKFLVGDSIERHEINDSFLMPPATLLQFYQQKSVDPRYLGSFDMSVVDAVDSLRGAILDGIHFERENAGEAHHSTGGLVDVAIVDLEGPRFLR